MGGAQPTFLCDARGSLVLYFGSERAATDAEWDRYLELITEAGRPENRVRILIVANAQPAPSPLQRRRASDVVNKLPHKSAVIASSVVARMVVTALRWLGMEMQAFAPSDVSQALAYLEVTDGENAWLNEKQAEFGARLSVPKVAP